MTEGNPPNEQGGDAGQETGFSDQDRERITSKSGSDGIREHLKEIRDSLGNQNDEGGQGK